MSMALTRSQRRRRNAYVFGGLFALVIAMNGFAYAMVPAYRAFCQQFGFAGTPIVEANGPESDVVLRDRTITVRFNSDIAPDLDWRFKPVQRSIDLNPGETGLTFYEAVNNAERDVSGTATFNVTPLKAAPYFVKIECFCFTEQTLSPGQVAQMPVTFYVDPAIAEDQNLDDVTTITLSYTFFRDMDAKTEQAAAAGDAEEAKKIQVN
jgi:cytochrome c oxidase assembly protein subunit 11